MPKLSRLSLTALAAFVLALALPAGSAFAQYLRVYYPDIEQGAATVVVSPTGSGMLVDAGSGLAAADDDIVLFLDDLVAQGVLTALDYVVVSHYDEDHIGRLEDVLNYGPTSPTLVTYDRGEFGGVPSTFAYSDYSWAAASKNRTLITPGTSFGLGGGVSVDTVVVNAELPNGQQVDLTGVSQFENNVSVGLVVRYGDFDVWIGGDLTGNPDTGVADVESPASGFTGDVDVYTVNHHGSRTSSNATFLGVLKAEVAVNQNSVDNNFGHPNTEVVTRFLATPDTDGQTPLFFQLNPGNPTDTRSDDSLAAGIADPDDVDEARGLPGTLLIISDGASYRVAGGAVAPVTLPADSGSGALADFPPAVLSTAHAPLVPLSNQPVSVDADVVDSGSLTVQLLWEIDGVAQAPIAMSQAGSGFHNATIPAQADGKLVTYRVKATDGAGHVELGAGFGYFSGVTPVATLRAVDANGLMLTRRLPARVEGHVTAEPGIFHPFVSQIYVQDDFGAGVQIFDRTLLPLNRGDRASFIGRVEQFSGQAELNIGEPFGNFGYQVLGAGTTPAPQVITGAQVGEAVEGRLVRLNNLTVVSGTIPETGSGNLTVTDDGGVTTFIVRVDSDTDIPGANTPSGTFDVVGIASQFDGSWPYDYGYQVLPRERADFLTAEVNLPPMLIHEIHADPANGANGDANGDGTRDSGDDEFVELINTGDTVDLAGWTISDAVGVKHVFATGTVVPAGEAVVVFGGGTPTGDFGAATSLGLVFTASSGSLSLNNSGDTVTLRDALGNVVQEVTYGGEGGADESLNRSPELTNGAFVKHSQVAGAGGARFSPGTRASGGFFLVPAGAVILTEVLYDPDGSDAGFEWVELVNTTTVPVDLSGMSLGSGGGDYTGSLVQLEGTIPPGGVFLVGGPTSDGTNGNPVYDQVFQFSPGLQNSGADADGVALFNVRSSQVTPLTVPVDAVVYGPVNTNGLIDETGAVSAPDVDDAPGGSSIERLDLAGTWQIRATPNPNVWSPGTPPPAPVAGLLLSEVLYDVTGGDDGYEWIELYNAGNAAIDLAAYSIGYGGTSWGNVFQLVGTVQPGQAFVVGGPTKAASNGRPNFDQSENFSPDLQNSGSVADGVALFAVPASQWTANEVPVDAVVYGTTNSSGLIDETGVANASEVGDAPADSSIERTTVGGAWQIQSSPTPGSSPL